MGRHPHNAHYMDLQKQTKGWFVLLNKKHVDWPNGPTKWGPYSSKMTAALRRSEREKQPAFFQPIVNFVFSMRTKQGQPVRVELRDGGEVIGRYYTETASNTAIDAVVVATGPEEVTIVHRHRTITSKGPAVGRMLRVIQRMHWTPVSNT
jgi:hypothetical protein